MAVYMIQGESRFGPVKIGHSHDPEVRLGQLQISHWEELRIIRRFEGGEPEENDLHMRFSDLHMRGEWHSFSRAMLGDVGLSEIMKVVAPPPPAATGFVSFPRKLRAFLDETKTPVARFAGAIGVSVAALHRYAAGERIPRAEILERIAKETGGSVQPNDFFAFAASSERSV